MRAAGAARDCREISSGLKEQLLPHANRLNVPLVDGGAQAVFPLLRAILGEFTRPHAELSQAYLGVWLLERAGAPEELLANIKIWAASNSPGPPPPPARPRTAPTAPPRTSLRAAAAPPAPKATKFLTDESAAASRSDVHEDGEEHDDEDEGDEAWVNHSPSSASTGVAPTSSLKKEGSTIHKEKKLQMSAEPGHDAEDANEEEKKRHWNEAAQMAQQNSRRKSIAAERSMSLRGERMSLANDEALAVSHQKRKSVVVSEAAETAEAARRKARASLVVPAGLQDTALRRRIFSIASAQIKVPPPPEKETIELLRNVSAFKGLSEEDLKKIAAIAKCSVYQMGTNVVNFGNASEELHVVVSGTGKISVPRQVGQVSRGDVFGEEALQLADATSPVQIVPTGGPITTITIPSDQFGELQLRRERLHRTKRESIVRTTQMRDSLPGTQTSISMDTGRPILKDYVMTAADREMIFMAIRNNKILDDVLQLNDAQCELVADSVHAIRVEPGEILMQKGDQGMALYIVQEGLLDVDIGAVLDKRIVIRAGESFGELALMHDTPRAATIRADKASVLWVLPRAEFNYVSRLNCTARIAAYSEVIKNIPFIQTIVDAGNGALDAIAGALEETYAMEGDDVCVAGEDAGMLFILYEGSCEVQKEGEQEAKPMQQYDWVGEEQLEKNVPAKVTMTVTSATAIVLSLDKDSLVRACDGAFHLRNRSSRATLSTDDVLDSRLGLDELQHMTVERVLGQGSFGFVTLLSDESGLQKYALKALKKSQITKLDIGEHIENERSVSMLFDSDFIVRFYAAYHDAKTVYFLLEPVLGGELFDIYQDNDLFGNIDCARFHIGCVIFGLQHIHSKHVVYRDLKLENCLMDHRGYVKLADMGIAKVVVGKTYTICGTADYFAPETLRKHGHNRAADWWACGILLFIMVAGQSPFDAPEVSQVYKNIMKGFTQVKFPKHFTNDLIEVVKSLCRKTPEERITMQKGGVDTLSQMTFFNKLDWGDLALQKMVAPFLPTVSNNDAGGGERKAVKEAIDWESVEAWLGPYEDVNAPEKPEKSKG
eukprot:TRINITY_DN18572_c0_g2_i1.p1 TRINITY_DN18572_c0_g2~~TRINITY_DN18572_c0_g2_i1.p1  ORF type:complete len:1059 (-),score=261.60 TRINITY_DN18572_c0_g2_i1:95-3271(-)